MKLSESARRPRMRGSRSIFIAALAVLAVAVISSVKIFNASSRAASSGDGDTINVAIGYGPMSLYRYGDTLGGFNYEMMREMARIDRLPVKFHPVSSLADALENLRKGAYDVVISDLAMTAAQKEMVAFTVPVYVDRLVLVSRDSAVTTPLLLAGKKVWAPEGSPAVERLENLEREIGDTIYIEDSHRYTSEQLLLLVAKGEVERAVVNEAVAREMTREYPDLCISTHISFNQFQAWAVAKENTRLLEMLDSKIEAFKKTPFYKSLCEKWLMDAED